MNYRKEVLRNCPNFDQCTLQEKLSLGALGVAGEAGEVADLVKKILHHRREGETCDMALEINEQKLIKEMGDVYWYLEFLGAVLGIQTEDVLFANVAKLHKRHPTGWTPESQQAKKDEQGVNHATN